MGKLDSNNEKAIMDYADLIHEQMQNRQPRTINSAEIVEISEPRVQVNAVTRYQSNNSNNNTTKPKSSTTKPDSGSFSTKPNTNSKFNQNETSNSKNKKNDEYDDYSGGSSRRTYIPSAYGRGFFGFGGYNPFRYMGYRMGISPIIMDIVMIITVLIVLYIIIDFIRSRKNR